MKRDKEQIKTSYYNKAPTGQDYYRRPKNKVAIAIQLFVVFISMMGLIYLCLASYRALKAFYAITPPVNISASQLPIKTIPEDSGIKPVENQDKEVYDAIKKKTNYDVTTKIIENGDRPLTLDELLASEEGDGSPQEKEAATATIEARIACFVSKKEALSLLDKVKVVDKVKQYSYFIEVGSGKKPYCLEVGFFTKQSQVQQFCASLSDLKIDQSKCSVAK